VIFHPAGESHSDIYHGRPSLEVNVEISDGKFGELLRAGLASRELPGSEEHRIAQVTRALCQESWHSGQLSASALEGLLAGLLAKVLVEDGSEPELEIPGWLREAKFLIVTRFREHLTLPAIAHAVDHHPMHLAREYHRHYTRTVGQEIRRLRIEFACRRILEGEPLAAVALEAGFYDQSHFTRVFKSALGITPHSFRCDTPRLRS
jgi:AraC-like DNA-binding protein